MNKKLIIVIIVIAICTGVGLGILIQKNWLLVGRTNISKLNSQYPELNLAQCHDNSGVFVSMPCIEEKLLKAALSQKNREYCNAIETEVVKQECFSRLNRLNALPNQITCEGDSQQLCLDLGNYLKAVESADADICVNISDQNLFGSCLLRTVVDNDLEPQVPVRNNLFGPLCEPGVAECDTMRLVFKQAVLDNDTNACQSIENEDMRVYCRQEVKFYDLYNNGSIENCLNFDAPDYCRYDYLTTQSIETDDVSVCEQISDENIANSCKALVNIGGVQRFGYLQE